MDVAFPKSKEMVNDSAKIESSTPLQTAKGKESTNPLSPAALGKSRMVNLSPEQFIAQRFEPNGYKKAVEKDINANYYVIYNGQYEGIYTDWGIVSSLIKGTSTTCKKFKTLEQARQSAEDHDREVGTNIVFKEIKVQKESYKRARPYVKEEAPEQKEIIEEKSEGITLEDFRKNWIAARKASHAEYKTENLCTDDKITRSLYIFFENAEAQKVYFAFQSGLIKSIYPSPNLQELKYFPKGITKAIKNFRTKILKASDKPMFINITSSIPDWSVSVKHNPYHFIEIGLAKLREFNPSKIMEQDFPQYEEIVNYRAQGLKLVTQKILNIKENSKVKVNYCDDHCIITSWCPSEISKEDIAKVTKFEEPFFKNTIDVSTITKQAFCKKARKLFLEHTCRICEESAAEEANKTPTYFSGEDSADDFSAYQE